MKSVFQILTMVRFCHSYFSSGDFAHLGVQPLEATQKLMQNLGMVCKIRNTGFVILFDTTPDGRLLSKADMLADEVELQFKLTLNDAHFYNYTQLEASDISHNVFQFSNTDASVNDGIYYLHKETAVSQADMVSAGQLGVPFFQKPFGLIRLVLRPDLKEEYHIQFESKKTYWRYILASEHLQKLNAPFIINGDSKEVFSGPVSIQLPDRTSAIAFVSKEPLSLRDRNTKVYQLVENYNPAAERHKTVIRSLPAPDSNLLSSLGSSDDPHTFSEIFIY